MERMQFIGPNLNAPRNRDMPVDFLNYPARDLTGFFSRMKAQHPQLSSYSNRDLAKCIELYNESLAHEVVNSGWEGVRLPEDLGFVIVSASKVPIETATKNIDFNTSRQLGVCVPYQNFHSSGFVAKINYFNNIPWHRFKNHHQWKFKPCRKLQRAVSEAFKIGRQNYFKHFSKTFPISALFRKPKALC